MVSASVCVEIASVTLQLSPDSQVIERALEQARVSQRRIRAAAANSLYMARSGEPRFHAILATMSWRTSIFEQLDARAGSTSVRNRRRSPSIPGVGPRRRMPSSASPRPGGTPAAVEQEECLGLGQICHITRNTCLKLTRMLHDALGGLVFVRRVAAFEDHQHIVVIPNEVALQLDPLDLQAMQRVLRSPPPRARCIGLGNALCSRTRSRHGSVGAVPRTPRAPAVIDSS